MIADVPAVYEMTDAEYFADPVPGGSLTSTGARRLLAVPPARWLYEQGQPHVATPAMILGTAVHSLTLGAGPLVVEIEADSFRTKAAQAARDEAIAAGNIPLLTEDCERASAMADAVRAHPVADALFSPERGKPEQVMVWYDAEFGVWRRAKVDHLPHPHARSIVVDLKTTVDGSPEGFTKSVANYRYDQQAAFYLDGYRALFPDSDPEFLFVCVEKDPPHLVSVLELDDEALAAGAARNRQALEIYRDCRESGIWPGHSEEIELVSLPPWAARTEVYR